MISRRLILGLVFSFVCLLPISSSNAARRASLRVNAISSEDPLSVKIKVTSGFALRSTSRLRINYGDSQENALTSRFTRTLNRRSTEVKLRLKSAGEFCFVAELLESRKIVAKTKRSCVSVQDSPAKNAAILDLAFKTGEGSCLSGSTDSIIEIFNGERIKRGLNLLAVNPKLMLAAESHSLFMSRASEVTERGSKDRLLAAGFTKLPTASAFGNNFASSGDFVAFLFQAPADPSTLLNPIFNEIGVGCIVTEGSRTWISMFLGR